MCEEQLPARPPSGTFWRVHSQDVVAVECWTQWLSVWHVGCVCKLTPNEPWLKQPQQRRYTETCVRACAAAHLCVCGLLLQGQDICDCLERTHVGHACEGCRHTLSSPARHRAAFHSQRRDALSLRLDDALTYSPLVMKQRLGTLVAVCHRLVRVGPVGGSMGAGACGGWRPGSAARAVHQPAVERPG